MNLNVKKIDIYDTVNLSEGEVLEKLAVKVVASIASDLGFSRSLIHKVFLLESEDCSSVTINIETIHKWSIPYECKKQDFENRITGIEFQSLLADLVEVLNSIGYYPVRVDLTYDRKKTTVTEFSIFVEG